MIRTVTGSIIILLCMSLCCIYFYSEMPSQNLICGYITNEVRQGDTTEYIVSLKTKDGIIDGVKAQQIDVAALFDNDIYPQIDKLINKEKFMEEYKFLVHTQKYLLQPPETRLMRYKEYKINPNKTLPKPIKKEFKELIIKPVIYNKPVAPIKLPKQEVTVSYDYNYSEPTVKEYKNVLYYCNKALTGFNLLGFVGKLLKRNQ